MQTLTFDGTFGGWKTAARAALAKELPPAVVDWQTANADQPWLALGEQPADFDAGTPTPGAEVRVPRGFLELARTVSCHRDDARWALLYCTLWRLTHGEPHLLKVSVDPDVRALEERAKAVRREVHKMRAFVRFREVPTAAGPWYVAWFEPQHPIVSANAGFFVERYAHLRWSILTPEECMHWDTEQLWFSEGVTRDQAPKEDATEDLWRTYYRNIFNPARLKIGAMKAEMAPHYWKNLPEAEDIPTLIAEAPERTRAMVAASRARAPSVPEYHPAPVPATQDLNELRQAVGGCRACPLWQNASCAVFGEGRPTARVMLVGEQPGDQEDRAGRPFVGPAGQLLNRALAEAGVDRAQLYVTNAVKHFKWTPRGKRRLHENPNDLELAACRPWLQAEVRAINPKLIVCLGASAARSVLGRSIRVLAERGTLQPSTFGRPALVTVHPSMLLRLPDPTEAKAAFAHFVADLKIIHAAAS